MMASIAHSQTSRFVQIVSTLIVVVSASVDTYCNCFSRSNWFASILISRSSNLTRYSDLFSHKPQLQLTHFALDHNHLITSKLNRPARNQGSREPPPRFDNGVETYFQLT